MLIRLPILHRIKSGEVTLAFRRWRRPTVRTGGTPHTAVGVLAIASVEKVAARRPVLAAIARHPQVAAQTLATVLGYERDWLKGNVRKLKNLGLTESHHPGYTLSPRGRSVFDHLPADRRRTATSRSVSV